MKRLLLLGVLALAGCEQHLPSDRWLFSPLFVRTDLTPDRIAGRWYEVGHFPAPYQRDCTHTVADYQPQADGTIAVTNRCRIGTEIHEIRGTARVSSPGELSVRLKGVPFSGDLLILGQSRDGRTLVLGTSSRIAGWVLHRDARIDPDEFQAARDLFERSGYDAAALQYTDQR